MPAHPVLPNPWYYLNNFQFMLDWVSARYQGLLAPEEQSFIAGFAALPKPSRGLLVRMVMRKGDLFRPANWPTLRSAIRKQQPRCWPMAGLCKIPR